jgi:enoyl-CoA hydratase/carnithine racemase
VACDMRFAARESALFSQPEQGFGLIPGAGGVQHLARLVGRGRALEIMLSAEDYDAELAERYGWINRALPQDQLHDFVRALAHRIAKFPATGQATLKRRVNAVTLAPAEDFQRDSELFVDAALSRETQDRFKAAFGFGLQTPKGELALAQMLSNLTDT